MSWLFNPMLRGDLNIDPFEGEFFATEALGSITDALVREAIQNSLDASVPGEIVEVRLALGRAGDAARDRYLEGLWPHVESGREPASRPPRPNEPLAFLAIEDRGTRGLEGDPEQDDDDVTPGGPRNDFYYFWRNVGRSRKESTERGRWGLGKTVFAKASRVQSFFGITVRRSDGRVLLMGQAVLRIHRVGGERFRPYGYYGIHRERFSLPVEDRAAIEQFARSFGLRRLEAPGLSLVIAYPEREITRDELVESVVHHYFYPLLAGRLKVEVEDEGSSIVLDAASLHREIRRSRREGVRRSLPLVELALWGLHPEPEALAELKAPLAGRAPKLTADLFEPADLERLRRRFDAGQRIALHVPVTIQEAGGRAAESRFLLLMEREEAGQRGEGHFVRQGITIGNPAVRRPPGVRWIVVVTDGALSTFLGDAENPAHTEWQRGSPKFKEKYRLGPSTLDFVKAAPHNVAAILSRPAEGRDPDLLRTIFSLPTEEKAIEAATGQKPEAGPAEEAATIEGAVGGLGGDGRLVLTRVERGFRLTGNVADGGPRRIRIVVAYEVLRGDPFRRYSPLDFRVDEKPITVSATGARIVAQQGNRIEVEAHEPGFEVVVTGFDVHRDLRIKVEPLGSAP